MEKEIDPRRLQQIAREAPKIAKALNISIDDATRRVIDLLPRFATANQVTDAIRRVKANVKNLMNDDRPQD